MFSLFRRHTRLAKPARRTPRSIRPCLEALEDRLTPSTGGALDPTFGTGGIVTTSFTNSYDQPQAVVAQPDGKLVVAGISQVPSGKFLAPPISVMQVARYNVNGTLDTTFGTGGHVTTDFNKAGAQANAVALQPQADGANKILAAGQVIMSGGKAAGSDFGLVCYNTNGSLDTTFGTGGKVETDLGSSNEQPTSIVVQPDGKIVLAGYTNTSIGTMAALVRYNANGSLDTSFDNGGKLITSIKTNQDTGIAVQTQPGGSFKLVLAGTTPVTVGASTWNSLFAARFNANGTADTGFGTGGKVTTLTGTHESFGGLAVQPDGKVVVAGGKMTRVPGLFSYAPLVVRYNADGTPDRSFGPSGDGTATVPLPAGYSTFKPGGVAIQADGQIEVGGALISSGTAAYSFAMTRFNGDHSANGPAGTVDSGYGKAGWATAQTGATDIAATGYSQTVALEPDGRAVIVGMESQTLNKGPYNFAVARFLESAPQVGSFVANPNPMTAGNCVTLTASNISDGSPGVSITQVAFYLDSNNDGTLTPGTDTLLGYATQTSPGVWTLTDSSAFGLAVGTYTLFAQAKDSDGVFGDPVALTLIVQ